MFHIGIPESFSKGPAATIPLPHQINDDDDDDDDDGVGGGIGGDNDVCGGDNFYFKTCYKTSGLF